MTIMLEQPLYVNPFYINIFRRYRFRFLGYNFHLKSGSGSGTLAFEVEV